MNRSILATILVAGSVVSANAADLGLANRFNAFIFNNATLNGGHADGAVAVGGNITGLRYEFQGKIYPATTGYASLAPYDKIGGYVKGDVTFDDGGAANRSSTVHVNGKFWNKGNPYNVNGGHLYANEIQGQINGNRTPGVQTVDPTIFAHGEGHARAIANWTRGLTATSLTGSGPAWPNVWEIDLDLVPRNADGQRIIRVDGSVFNNNANVALNLKDGLADDTVVFDVLGSGTLNWSWTTNYARPGRLLWNLRDFTAVNLSRSFLGSMLAVNATVTQNTGNIDGHLIAKNWVNNNSNEIHLDNNLRFTGNAPVPEPATLATLGLGLVAALRRRRAA